MSRAIIAAVAAQSPAEGRLLVGDEILRVNGRAPTDVIEYQQLIDSARVEIVLRRAGESLDRRIVIDKGEGEPLGVSVDSALFDRLRTCDNHCSFCFIYQLPKGLRRSLYVKDDDFRLSFLYGNFTTLTRFTELDLERVVEERLSPLYVSIHTTNPGLRASLLRNPRGATSLRWLAALLEAGIEVHGQVVVCPGVNDGLELERTLDDVITEYRDLASLCLVPLGLSDFSTEPDLRGHTAEEARAVVDLVERYRPLTLELLGRVVIAASDEFHLLAGRPAPGPEDLWGLDQAENGVGMVAAFRESFSGRTVGGPRTTGFFQSVDGAPAWGYRAPRSETAGSTRRGTPVVLTGEYAAPILGDLLRDSGRGDVEVLAVENRYFGGNIKVAGLLTTPDLTRAIVEHGAHGVYLLPDVCLNEDRFLDGGRLSDLPGDVRVVETSGSALAAAVDEVAGVLA